MDVKTLIVTSPRITGQPVRDAQWLLSHNRFGSFHPGPVDGVYGIQTGHAAKRAHYALGFPKKYWGPKAKHPLEFGDTLRLYLLGPKKGGKRLPATYLARRAFRLRTAKKSIKQEALALALAEAKKGITEYPPGSNHVKYAEWYGLNGYPWCAMFVTWCFSHAGDKNGLHSAYAYWFEEQARAHNHKLSITSSPEPGDIVVYHHMAGHVGIFYRWIDRTKGHFQSVEGNTSRFGSQDNGGAVLIQDRYTGWVPTVFVHVA